MVRRLSPDEAALWRKVVESVRPIDGKAAVEAPAPIPPKEVQTVAKRVRSAVPPPKAARAKAPGTTLDSSWDRRLSRGLVQPDLSLDLHGHNLATAYDLLDRKLEQAIAIGARTLLLITGKAPSPATPRRGAIRAAVGDWLGASRHAADIAAVRNAHPRHGGSGALYIILRRARTRPSE
jgi:DNA-nicking Smr family endonuclease